MSSEPGIDSPLLASEKKYPTRRSSEEEMFIISIFKWILIKVHLQIVGAWKICQEQIWDRHKNLPTGK